MMHEIATWLRSRQSRAEDEARFAAGTEERLYWEGQADGLALAIQRLQEFQDSIGSSSGS